LDFSKILNQLASTYTPHRVLFYIYTPEVATMEGDNNKTSSEEEKKPDSILGKIVGIPRRRPSTIKRRPNEEECSGDTTSTKNETILNSSSGWMRYFNPLNFFLSKKHFTDQDITRVSNVSELSPESRKGRMIFADEKKEVVPGEITRQSHLFNTLDLVRRKTLETIHIVKERSRPMIYFMPTWLLVISGLTCWFVFNANRISKSVAPTLEPSHESSIAP